ncbi:MAG: rRNA pseudouridine synthase [Deltaproteobacteria bacterium]|nr:rRNA pseudouridine synthase [Deltaproteobacteria bacterium]
MIVSRSDPEERKTIYDLLPKKYHTFRNVGRLDYQSQGALLLTNDGDLINKLTHPKHHVEKVYHIKLSSHPDEKQLQRLARGVILDGVRTLPASMKLVEKSMTSAILEMVLTEGRNRQVRRMCEAVGLTVKELRRVSIGPVKLGKLRSGAYRLLTSREIKALKSA